MKNRWMCGMACAIGALVGTLGTGCATYQVPGKAADFRALGITAGEQENLADRSINFEMSKKPAASFPARIGAIHVQDRGYRSHSYRGYSVGRLSIVTNRDIESGKYGLDLSGFRDLPMVESVIPLNRLVFGEEVSDELDLREAAARVQADMLFLYTFDTKFGVDTTIPALGVITLGIFPNNEARVTATASGALIDTRTGFVYMLTEATERSNQIANAWTSDDAVEETRLRAERRAFESMLGQVQDQWVALAEHYTAASINAMEAKLQEAQQHNER